MRWKAGCFAIWGSRAHPHGTAQSLNMYYFHTCVRSDKTTKSHTIPYHTQVNSVVDRGNKTLGNVLRAKLLEGDDEWDLKFPHIMGSIYSMPHNSTNETANILMLGRELRLPDQLFCGQLELEYGLDLTTV